MTRGDLGGTRVRCFFWFVIFCDRFGENMVGFVFFLCMNKFMSYEGVSKWCL